MGAAAVPLAVALLSAGATVAAAKMSQPDAADVPGSESEPDILDPEEAALRRMRRIRRDRSFLRIEPPAAGGTGLQIPS